VLVLGLATLGFLITEGDTDGDSVISEDLPLALAAVGLGRFRVDEVDNGFDFIRVLTPDDIFEPPIELCIIESCIRDIDEENDDTAKDFA
jgi:hypothetical protein